MEGPRSPQENEFSSVLQFLNANLRPQQGWSIQTEYPTALSNHNLKNMRIIKENDEILSHAVLRPLLTKTPVGIFKVAAIGSVVTSEKYRNRGLSKTVIEDCIREAQNQACDFAILWTNLYEFYRKFNFELAGSEISFIIDKDLPVPDGSLRFSHGANVSPEALIRLFTQHTVSTVRTYEEVRKYLQIPNSNLYTAWDKDGSLRAYLVEGKGADLQGYIHEWGGALSALLPLVNFARKQQNRPLTLIVPHHSTNLVRHLTGWNFQANNGFLGMIKIINPVTLLTKIARAIRSDFGVKDFVFEKRDRIFYIGVGQNLFSTDSEADIVRLIFGPHKPSEIHKFEPTTLSALEKVLPIPMWIWGWDSV